MRCCQGSAPAGERSLCCDPRRTRRLGGRRQLLRAAALAGVLWCLATGVTDAAAYLHISGSNTLLAQYADRPGVGQSGPAEFWRNDLRLTLDAGGLPLGLSLVVSSDQNSVRQDVSSLRAFIDTRALLRRGAGRFSFLQNFSVLEIGSCRPSYTPLTLQGSTVRGVNLEFTRGLFYAAVCSGRSRKAISSGPVSQRVCERRIRCGRIGIGPRDHSHLHLTLLHARDREDSLPADSSSGAAPQENYVVGLEGVVALLRGALLLEAELTSAALTRDTRTARLQSGERGIASWIEEFADARVSTSFDYAYRVRAVGRHRETRLRMSIREIGPGYASLGAPNLRGDRRSHEAQLQQSLLRRQLRLSAFWRQSIDNLADQKLSTSRSRAYGLSAALHLSGLPYVRLSYLPARLTNDRDSLTVESRNQVFTLDCGHSYTIGSMRSTTTLMISYQENENLTDVLVGGVGSTSSLFRSRAVSLSETLELSAPLSLRATLGLRSTDAGGETTLLSGGLQADYHRGRRWQAQMGTRFARETDQHTIALHASGSVAAGRIGRIELRGERAFHSDADDPGGDSGESILRLSVMTRW